jgi:hypothetical protein
MELDLGLELICYGFYVYFTSFFVWNFNCHKWQTLRFSKFDLKNSKAVLEKLPYFIKKLISSTLKGYKPVKTCQKSPPCITFEFSYSVFHVNGYLWPWLQDFWTRTRGV